MSLEKELLIEDKNRQIERLEEDAEAYWRLRDKLPELLREAYERGRADAEADASE